MGKSHFSKFFKENLIILAILILVVITGAFRPQFLTPANFTNLMRQFGPLALVSLGVTFILLGGYIDMSVAGIFSLVSVISLSLVSQIGEVPALAIGVLVGVAAGLANGLLLVIIGAQNSADALFVTYGMGTLYTAIALIYTGGATQRFEGDTPLLDVIGKGSVGVVSISFIIFCVCLVVLYIFQRKTYMGRSVYLLGGNMQAAKLCGIPVKGAITTIYGLTGLMTGIGAIVLFARVTSAKAISGTGYDIDAIMAVVIGGTSLSGGRGSVLRTVLGVALVTLLSNCLNLLGINPHIQYMMRGLVMVLAIWLDSRKDR